MSEQRDIVERLRDMKALAPVRLRAEAADEIASLRADRDKWHRIAMDAGAITCTDGSHLFPLKEEVQQLRNQLVKAREALEKIDKSDRIWTSHYAKDETDVLERAPSGNVLVHGHEGRIARNALIALTDEKGADVPTRQRLTFCDRCNSNQMHNFVAVVDGVSVFQCCCCALSSAYRKDEQ